LNINEEIKRNFPRRNHLLINYDDAEKGKIHLNYSCINIFQSERGIPNTHALYTLRVYIWNVGFLCVGKRFYSVYTIIYIYILYICIFYRERRKQFHKSSDNVRKLYTFTKFVYLELALYYLYIRLKRIGLTRHAQTAFETEIITPAAVTQTKWLVVDKNQFGTRSRHTAILTVATGIVIF